MKNNFDAFSEKYLPQINQRLADIFSIEVDSQFFPMINYALLAPGKRLRPLLTLAIVDGFGVSINQEIINLAAAVELVHAYSLVHDDLPSLDNDNMRRGQETVHKKYGENNAILVGDALLTHAFLEIADSNAPAEIKSELVRSLSIAAGPFNMVRGQFTDIHNDLIRNIEDLELSHQRKTAALFIYSAAAGGLLAQTSPENIRQLNIFAANFGIAFQILDDLHDFTQASDGNKKTYPQMIGVNESQSQLQARVLTAKEALLSIPDFNGQNLDDLLDSLVK